MGDRGSNPVRDISLRYCVQSGSEIPPSVFTTGCRGLARGQSGRSWTIFLFLAYFPKIKVGLSNHQPVSPPNNNF
jgi:hypothetical protein